MTHLITGGAGCIGSELAGALLARGDDVRVVDNLASGRLAHIEAFLPSVRFHFCRGDVTMATKRDYDNWLDGVDMVWHLSAKTDIKFIGEYDFCADYEENLSATWWLIEAMHRAGIRHLAFASSAAVYGYGEDGVIREDMLPAPVSMYGATKLACESLIRAMALRAGMRSWIFRYCSIVSGKARTSGNMVIPDFIHKLREDSNLLKIYGDGNQTKPSLHVSECVQAMQFVVDECKDDVSIHNIGVSDAISVTEQAHLVAEEMGLTPNFEYTGGAGGWPGDVPSFRMDVTKIMRLGWKAIRTSEQACKLAISQLLESGE